MPLPPLPLIEEVHQSLLRHKMTVSSMESCTGGILSTALTYFPGSSAYYIGGLSSYSNGVKSKVGHVQDRTLHQFGAVSSQVAGEMARGAKELFKTDLSCSVTGIAGPGGGSTEKPIGTVWFGISNHRTTTCHVQLFQGNRNNIRQDAATFALNLLLKELHH